jgi:hypothetical protein
MPNKTVRAAAQPMPATPQKRAENVLDALLDLEPSIRELNHLCAIFTEWACNCTFCDFNKTKEQRLREIDRLVFALCEIRDKVSALHKAFHAALEPPKG